MTAASNLLRTMAVLVSLTLVLTTTTLFVDRPADAQSASTTLREVSHRIGAMPLYAEGLSGAGIDVAVIDTGVEAVAGLDGYDKVIVGPDLSFEAGVDELYGHDTYGHGTVMASIIAGDDGPGGFQGVAPGSRILSIKVADNTGAVDVSQVIAALDWVVDNGRTNGLNVRVINLSYVTDSEQSYEIDPLAYAVERAWRAGYVVVVAAGNDGETTTLLGNPAADPYVIAVAAADGSGAAGFSSYGSKTRMPDILAPGDRILGLAAPNSRLTQNHPEAVIDGRFLRGSGTSQAAAIVSGAAALLLEQRPELTPDQVKALLILGVVDEEGNGRGSSMEATSGIARFFDLLDLEAEYRAQANELFAKAAELRTEVRSLTSEAAVLRSDAVLTLDESEVLISDVRPGRGHRNRWREYRATFVKQEAQAIETEAEDAALAATQNEIEARSLEEQAEKLVHAADEARREAEVVRVPEHVRERELAEAFRQSGKDLLAAAEALRARASSARVTVSEMAMKAEEVERQTKMMRDIAAGEEAVMDIVNVAKEIGATAEELDAQAAEVEQQAKQAFHDADRADLRADAALAALEEQIAKIFSNWNGSQLGGIEYNPQSGAGLIDLERSVALPAFNAVQYHAQSDGSGSLEASRGSNHVVLPDGTLLEGEVTFTGSTWTGSTWTGSTWTGSTWTGSTWTGSTWTGSTWTGSTWTGSTWTGSTWTGSTWTGSTWTGSTWTGSTWTGSRGRNLVHRISGGLRVASSCQLGLPA